jgi:hypothetical protein
MRPIVSTSDDQHLPYYVRFVSGSFDGLTDADESVSWSFFKEASRV